MGKKNKKLKKKKSTISLEHASSPAASAPVSTQSSEKVVPEAKTTPLASSPVTNSGEFKYVRGDVKKILLLLLGIVVLLIILYFVDIKTSYISDFGNWIYKILRIQTQ